MPTAEDPVHRASMRELGAILDDELRNLPAVCRAALVACHLEGLSTVEAARQLGVAASTLKSRLQRGRDLLRQRLSRRGIGLSLAALTAVLAEQSRAGATPTLVHVTVQTAPPGWVKFLSADPKGRRRWLRQQRAAGTRQRLDELMTAFGVGQQTLRSREPGSQRAAIAKK